MKHPIFRFSSILLLALLLVGCAEKQTQFPSKPITIVVPWDAGGGTDSLARSLAIQASDVFGVVVNVLNRSGGAGAVGHSFGATARPDGYTVTMITYELCTYAPLGRVDLTPQNYKPVMQLNEDAAAITVQADAPWKTLGELIAHAKENPGAVTVGNSGPGAVWHIGALKLEQAAGVKFTHVPHNGAKPAVTQLLGGHLDAVSVSPAEVLQYLELGQLRCLGVMAEERSPQLPDVPTLKEQGYDLVHGTWRGLAVPPETPDAIVAELVDGFKAAYEKDAFVETAEKAMIGLKYRGPDAFDTFLDREYESVKNLLSDTSLVVQSGARTYMLPNFYGGLFFLFCLVLLVRTLMQRKQGGEGKAEEEKETPADATKPLLVFVGLLVYAGLIFTIGYILSTILYLCFMFVYLGERRPARVGLFSVGIVVIIYIIFRTILDVPLPVFWG
ncbi:tripartite tricarboxylate transporter substrate binding protein [bacterium]|nr:tripartite tricarboxylate transporter substrate binding protein [bacterium]